MQDKSAPDGSAGGPMMAPAASASAVTGPSGLWLFTVTTFVSALLLFSIQPMFAKMVLPVLGGSPSVWAVALCFFQGALLAGYCYAHFIIRVLGARNSGIVHIIVCLLAFVVLPIGLPKGWIEPPTGAPYLWQLGLFTVGVGLPFFAVAANAPLLQAWFAASGHPHGRDPYFLYAASNLGSLIALLSYPLLLEPAFGLKALSTIWTIGFAVLVLLIAASYLAVRGGDGSAITKTAAGDAAGMMDDRPAPTWASRLAWVGLALVPSALLTAFTTHVTTDVASAPLLWVLPLALYLLTFVLVFRERMLIPMPILLAAHLASVILALLVLSQTVRESWFVTAGTGVAVFFTSAMVAHRTLYDARPAASHLTEFYLWMSLGGVLGGLFAALVAPQIFSEVFEYPLLLALSMACRPRALAISTKDRDELLVLWLLIASGVLILIWGPWLTTRFDIDFRYGTTAALVAVFAAAVLVFWKWPTRQLVMALMMFLAVALYPSGVKRGEAQRSYFGVYRVSSAGDYNILMHGTTLHGAQRVRDDKMMKIEDPTPGTYYYPKSPMAQAVRIVREGLAKAAPAGTEPRPGRYGVIGLGAGSLACLSRPGDRFRFFEIDPLMVSIAKNPDNFSFLSKCQPNIDIVLGDARLTIGREPDSSLDLIIVDAFSSDAVPVHLMTAEALRLFLAKLTPNGVVVLHVSNRYLDLDGVAAATLKLVPGAKGLIISDDEADGSYAQTSSTVVVYAHSEEVLAPFRQLETIYELDPRGLRAWTDDFSDIIGPFRSKLNQ